MVDQIFLVDLKSKKLKPSLASYPLWLVSKIFKSTFDLWNLIYIDEGLRVYSLLIKEHYSENGRGYLNFRGLSDIEQAKIYKNQRFGRIEFFIKNNIRTLDYQNGNSFLDFGCGFGQNIIVFERYFPHSRVLGFDVNNDVISILNKGTVGNPNIEASLGNITDEGEDARTSIHFVGFILTPFVYWSLMSAISVFLLASIFEVRPAIMGWQQITLIQSVPFYIIIWSLMYPLFWLINKISLTFCLDSLNDFMWENRINKLNKHQTFTKLDRLLKTLNSKVKDLM